MVAKLGGKVAIVTGAARGMGSLHALALAREGADVAVVDICHNVSSSAYSLGGEDELSKVVQDIESLGRRAIAVKCDVSNAHEVEEMVKKVVNEFGKIDILINNAGVLTISPLLTLTEHDWDHVMDVNLKGQWLCCRHVLPLMIARRAGKIVNIGSTGGRHGAKGIGSYCCSKAGVHMLTDALSKEVAEYDINVNCVAPGHVVTPMSEYFVRTSATQLGLGAEEVLRAAIEAQQTLPRQITPEDVSNAVIFLASEESRSIDGSVIYVDGGH